MNVFSFGTSFASSKQYKAIFSFHARIQNRLVSRESSWLEFKESFNWADKAKYAKTIAAFANNKGGYIVFGVQNNPRNLVGLKNERFQELDESKIAEYLNSAFSPEIKFEKFMLEVNSKAVGILYAYQSEFSPVICTKHDTDIKEAEIYYRYNASSEKIKYSELVHILDEVRNKERRIWQNVFERVAKIGPTNVAILDTLSGKIEGKGGNLLIDSKLISKLKFIREGHFREGGKPTLRLIGDVEPVTISEARKEAASVHYSISNDPHAFPIRLEEKNVLEKYPLSYMALTKELHKRYGDFKETQKYHDIRKQLKKNKTYCWTRLLDPGNAKSTSKDFYSEEILKEFDKHYTKTDV